VAPPQKSGQLIRVDIRAHSLPFEGRAARLVVAHDITEPVLALQAAQRSEARWERLFDASAIGIASAGPDGRFTHVNPACCGLVGRDAAQLTGLQMLGFTHADDAPPCAEQVRRLLAGELPSFVEERRYLRPDGQAVWVRVAVTLTQAGDGQAERQLVAVVQDIDAQHQAQNALHRQHELAEMAGRLARLGGWELRQSPPDLRWTEELLCILDCPPGYRPALDEALA
jgi:PAS domain S-box-containing protein